MEGMTYCEICGKHKKNDECREHIVSVKHLEVEEKIIVKYET